MNTTYTSFHLFTLLSFVYPLGCVIAQSIQYVPYRKYVSNNALVYIFHDASLFLAVLHKECMCVYTLFLSFICMQICGYQSLLALHFSRTPGLKTGTSPLAVNFSTTLYICHFLSLKIENASV